MKKRTAVLCYTKRDQRKQSTLSNLARAARAADNVPLAEKMEAEHRGVWDARCARAKALRPRPAALFVRNERGFRWEHGQKVAR